MDLRLITLTTDFGSDSHYVAQMKGAIYRVNPQATIVDVSHRIPPQDLRSGAWVLNNVADAFPPETIHVAVIDPGVGTGRAIICAQLDCGIYLAPDNGLLTLTAQRHPPRRIVELTESRLWHEQVSATFHGRDIMAPVAAHLSLGTPLHALGPGRDRLVLLDMPGPIVHPRQVEGTVCYIDGFGNLISNISSREIQHLDEPRHVILNNSIIPIVRTYGEADDGALAALVGSNGHLEIAVVNGDAAQRLQAKTGDKVVVRGGTVNQCTECL
jgi:hypothetical protein